jgi:hypothetical protein
MGRDFAWIIASGLIQSIHHGFRFGITEFLDPKSIFSMRSWLKKRLWATAREDLTPIFAT